MAQGSEPPTTTAPADLAPETVDGGRPDRRGGGQLRPGPGPRLRALTAATWSAPAHLRGRQRRHRGRVAARHRLPHPRRSHHQRRPAGVHPALRHLGVSSLVDILTNSRTPGLDTLGRAGTVLRRGPARHGPRHGHLRGGLAGDPGVRRLHGHRHRGPSGRRRGRRCLAGQPGRLLRRPAPRPRRPRPAGPASAATPTGTSTSGRSSRRRTRSRTTARWASCSAPPADTRCGRPTCTS